MGGCKIITFLFNSSNPSRNTPTKIREMIDEGVKTYVF